METNGNEPIRCRLKLEINGMGGKPSVAGCCLGLTLASGTSRDRLRCPATRCGGLAPGGVLPAASDDDEEEAEEAGEWSSFPSARLVDILCGWIPPGDNSGSSRLTPAAAEAEAATAAAAAKAEEEEEEEKEEEEVSLAAEELGLIGVGMRLVRVTAVEVTEEAAEEEALSFSADVSQLLGYLTASATLSLHSFDLGEASTTRGSIRTGSCCCGCC